MEPSEEGQAVNLLRVHAGFPSGKALADECGVAASVINNIMGGKTRRLHTDTRNAIEQATGAPLGTLKRVAEGTITAEQAVALAADEPVDPDERRSLAWRVTQLEAAVSELAERLAHPDDRG